MSDAEEDTASLEGSTGFQEETRPVDEEIDVKRDPPPGKGKVLVDCKSGKKIPKKPNFETKPSTSKKNLPPKNKSILKRKSSESDEPNKSQSTQSKKGKGKSSKYSSKLAKGLTNVKVEPPLQETASSNSGLTLTSGFSDVVQDGKFLGKIKKIVDANGKVTVQILKPKRNTMVSQSTITEPSNSETANQPTSSKHVTKEKNYLKQSMKSNKEDPPELKDQADGLWNLDVQSKEGTSSVLIQTPPLFGEDDQALNKSSQTEELSKILSCCQIELMCGICHELFIKPVMLLCGHSYCTNCIHDHIETSIKSKAECPVCCEVISVKPSRNIVVENLIERLHSEGWDKELVKNRNELLKERKQEETRCHQTTTGIPVQEEAIFFYR